MKENKERNFMMILLMVVYFVPGVALATEWVTVNFDDKCTVTYMPPNNENGKAFFVRKFECKDGTGFFNLDMNFKVDRSCFPDGTCLERGEKSGNNEIDKRREEHFAFLDEAIFPGGDFYLVLLSLEIDRFCKDMDSFLVDNIPVL